jgi:prepilin-type N-terminal cleavage/methylation domain-containing protein
MDAKARNQNRKRKSSFTLIELLVVVAIIAVLIALLMPALGQARQMARLIQCQSLLTNIGKGMAYYANEFNDQLPMYYVNPSTSGRGENPTVWSAMLVGGATSGHAGTGVNYIGLNPYTTNIYRCPNDTSLILYET